jgi:hypothetical protein
LLGRETLGQGQVGIHAEIDRPAVVAVELPEVVLRHRLQAERPHLHGAGEFEVILAPALLQHQPVAREGEEPGQGRRRFRRIDRPDELAAYLHGVLRCVHR